MHVSENNEAEKKSKKQKKKRKKREKVAIDHIAFRHLNWIGYKMLQIGIIL